LAGRQPTLDAQRVKKPARLRPKRVFETPSLAEFLKRPQSENQISADGNGTRGCGAMAIGIFA
jgi:hypothetical protein